MKILNDLLQELGISKVKLAKYLGVSRQMVYNYLELDSLSKWPKEKKILILKLLGIDNGNEETFKNIEITTDYLMEVESRLNQGLKNSLNFDSSFNLSGLNKDEQTLISDITFLLKDKLLDEKDNPKNKEHYYAFLYLYNILQAIDNIPEIKYIFGYLAKSAGFVDPNAFVFNEDRQFIFESIIHSAITLYHNGGASKSKLIETHKKFVQEIEEKKEEKLSRTEQLNTVKIQALHELGYTEINEDNAAEVFEKIAEIESRKV